jgi:hypothetical protein
MEAIIDRALPEDRVEFQSGLRQAIHRHPLAGARQVGTTAVSEGLCPATWPDCD